MRKESFTAGEYYHLYNRGARKNAIIRDANDRWRFLQTLYYLNTEETPPNPFYELKEELGENFNRRLIWPRSWSMQKPIIAILAFALMENHFHILAKEVREGGIRVFMHRFGTAMAMRFNTKYQESGRLFQGPFRARHISQEGSHLEYASVYVQVKNPFELYFAEAPNNVSENINASTQKENPDFLRLSLKKSGFEGAYKWAVQYPYCSLGDYAGMRQSPIINKDLLGELHPTPAAYKKLAQECLVRMDLEEFLKPLNLEG